MCRRVGDRRGFGGDTLFYWICDDNDRITPIILAKKGELQ